MHSLTVIVAQSDCVAAAHLAASLHAEFKNVEVARDLDELYRLVQHSRADIVICDLELADFDQVRALIEEFANVGVICTHRTPDEEMWRLCLESGALDCCSCLDVPGITRAARRHTHALAVSAA